MTAFEALVESHTPSVYRLARAYIGDAGAPDVVQDAFLAAWRSLPQLRDLDRFEPWLHRIAVNHCRSALRGRARVREIELDATDPSGGPTSRDFRPAVEARALVEPAFRRLHEDHRAVIALHYAAGLPIREVADVLQIPEGTAKSRLNAALTQLRRHVVREP